MNQKQKSFGEPGYRAKNKCMFYIHLHMFWSLLQAPKTQTLTNIDIEHYSPILAVI